MAKLKVGVLASGGGTDLQSIIDASEKNMINAEVVVVITDNKDAYALKRAEKHKIKTFFVDPKNKNKQDYDKEIDKILENSKVDLVVGAGFMRMLSSCFVRKWYGKLINIHPALLPSFKGVNGQGDALNYGVRISGCTTHFMDEKPDHGPIILQAAVTVSQNDGREILAQRILNVEHQILPRSIDLFEQQRLVVEGRKVRILPGDSWVEEALPGVLYSEGF